MLHFNPHTKPPDNPYHTKEPYRLLIVDGHSSHIHPKVVDYTLDHNIHMLFLPSHSTHIMQPLDVGLFVPLQHAYQQELMDWVYEYPTQRLRRAEFWPLLVAARQKVYTRRNICSAWEASGCYPVNPDRIQASTFLQLILVPTVPTTHLLPFTDTP